MSAQFRKKPVVIDAVTWYGKYTDGTEWPEWFREAVFVGKIVPTDAKVLLIHTLEGTMSAISGDWIIRGIVGEIYPCKDEIFKATYDPVEPDAALAATEPPNYYPSTQAVHGVTNLRGPLVLKHGPECSGCQGVAEQVRQAKRAATEPKETP